MDLVESRVKREVFGKLVDARLERVDVGVLSCGESGADDVGDFLVFLGSEAAGGECAGADAQAGGHGCGAWVERDGVAVDGDAALCEEVFALFAVHFAVA